MRRASSSRAARPPAWASTISLGSLAVESGAAGRFRDSAISVSTLFPTAHDGFYSPLDPRTAPADRP